MDSELDMTGRDLDILGEQIARMWFWSFYAADQLSDEDEDDIYDDLYDY